MPPMTCFTLYSQSHFFFHTTSFVNLCVFIVSYLSSIHISSCDLMTGAGLTGRSGEDVYIKVPLGTIISERFPDEEDDDEDLVWNILFIVVVFVLLG